ncbi:hypothetical protein VHEMI04271 [[Torrubiella] hemipterigena]|uniref:Glutathione S-transferase n=1 Tax=[Torrubiella] hemipterigena TaxID=1531966 RepID=A0A0A1TDC2_9HYPO|nr:hypothetical protein VHEMI04271 [[Torrubiella] hemipterigena]
MSLQPIKIYYSRGPNPPKVAIICEELGIPYEKVAVENSKSPEFVKINPNGRVPAIEDPNNDNLILWESGAIVEYLVEKYDKDHKISSANEADKWHLRQWLYFQTTGQGPYYGQAVWFYKYHPEQVPSAQKRYIGEIERVWGVLDASLKDKEYLVGDKCTYADIAFLPWEFGVHNFIGEQVKHIDVETKYPNYWAWYQRLVNRESAKKVYAP